MNSSEMFSPRAVDLMIVGAGPAGLAAAATATELGVNVTLIDEQRLAGGQIFRRPLGRGAPDLPAYAQAIANIRSDPAAYGVQYHAYSCAWGCDRNGLVFVSDEEGSRSYAPRQLIIASGATEWVAPAPGWTLPGVTTVGGAQSLLKGSGVVTGGRIAIGGIGPLLLQAAVQLIDAGAHVVAIFDAHGRRAYLRGAWRILGHVETAREGIALLAHLRRAKVPIYRGWRISEIRGSESVSAVLAHPVQHGIEAARRQLELEVDAVALSHGLVPSVELAAMRGCELVFDEALSVWTVKRDELMATSIDGVFAVGDGAAIHGARQAILEGRIATLAAASRLGKVTQRHATEQSAALHRQLRRLEPIRRYQQVALGYRSMLMHDTPADTMVCRCEGVTLGALREAIDEGAQSLHELRTRCRIGMGDCQGRMCITTVARFLAQRRGVTAASLGYPLQRPPIRPLTPVELSSIS